MFVSKNSDLVRWYDWVVHSSEIAYPGLVKGTLLICPRGLNIWDSIKAFIDREYKKIGVRNVSFSSLIPLSEIEKEKSKLSGFTPELFLVSNSSKQNEKPLFFLRPTSEILFSYFFRKILDSYDKLPLLFNQWCNVYRSEKNTRIFLRSCEFYWQEAHTLHLTEDDAMKFFYKFHEIYKKLIRNLLNIAVLEGEKTVNERFKGSKKTFALEAIMPDGQALQVATTHYLGNNFSSMFDVKYTGSDNKKYYPFQLSAGTSTRLIGSVILSHGDDKGLVLPIGLSDEPIKIYVINNSIEFEDDIYYKISDFLRDWIVNWYFSDKSFGYIMKQEELRGTPFVIIIGEKELLQNSVLFKSRISEEKKLIKFDELSDYIKRSVDEYSEYLYNSSKKNLDQHIVEVFTLEDAKREVLENKKIVLVPWFDDEENETNFNNEKLGFGPRCIKYRIEEENIKCFYCGKSANSYVYFGRSY